VEVMERRLQSEVCRAYQWTSCTRKFDLQLPRCTSHPSYQYIAILRSVNRVNKVNIQPPPHEQRPPI